MIIPRSQGAVVSPDAPLQQQTPISGVQKIGQTIGGVIQRHDEKLQEQEVSAKRLELYNNELDKKDGQLKVDEVLTTDFSNQVADLKNKVGNGALNSQQAQEQLKTWSDERFTQLKQSLPTFAHKDYQDYWDATVNRQQGSFFPLQLKADEQRTIVQSDQALQISTRLNREEGKKYLGNFLLTASIPESQKESMMIGYEQTRDKMELDQGIEQAFASGDMQALQEVATSIKDKKYIDGPTAQRYSTSITSKISTLQQRAEVEERKRENEAGKVFNNFKSAVLTGSDLGEELLANTETAVKGTQYEADFNFYKKQSKYFQDFRGLDTSEQLKMINQYKVGQKNSKSNDPESENKILSVLQNIYADKLKTIKDNPSLSLKQKGINLPELDAGEMKANQGSFASKLANIGSYQIAARDKDANATIKPISPEELPSIQAEFNKFSVQEKLNLIGSFIQQTKNIKNGQLIWKSALDQIGGADRTYLLAGNAKAKNKKMNGDDLATTLINGKFLVDSGKYVLPTELETKFREKYGNLGDYGNFADDFKSFQLSYAVIANRNGIQHSKKDDVTDSNSINKAFDLALGGVYEQPKTSWFGGFKTSEGGSFKNWKVPKPYGMSDDKFNNYLEAGYNKLSKDLNVSVNDLKGLRLRPYIRKNSTDVAYDLINERGQPIYTNNGKTHWYINFNGVSR